MVTVSKRRKTGLVLPTLVLLEFSRYVLTSTAFLHNKTISRLLFPDFFNGSFESRQQNNHPKVVHLDASRVTARGLYDLVSRFWDFQSCQNSTLAKSEGKDKQKNG